MYQQSSDQGSFLVGLTCGIVAGAFGYFLFATERGEEVRQELAKEWQAAKKELPLEEVAQEVSQAVGVKGDLREALWSLFATLSQTNNDTATSANKSHTKVKAKKQSLKKPEKKSDTKFKGI